MLIFRHKSPSYLVQSESDTLLLESSFASWKKLEKRAYSLVTYEPRLQNQKWAQGLD